MITIRNLKKTYKGGFTAIENINLDIGKGMFGLIGPNGAGKTTLMRIIAGLLTPTAGEISVLSNDITKANGKRKMKSELGYLPQELGVYPNLSAHEFLDYMAILKGVHDSNTRRTQVDKLLEQMGLSNVGKRRLKTFSGGMKRRIGIAQALLGDPKLIIVDEPTVGLDPEERVRFRNMLADIATDRTVILSTHIIEDISQSCKTLAVMNHGTVIFTGSPSELITKANGHVYTVITPAKRPQGNITIVSTLQVQDGVQYRILGQPDNDYAIEQAQPNLEDGYIWLMQKQHKAPLF